MISREVGDSTVMACGGAAAGRQTAECEEEQAGCPKIPVDPGRPTKMEIEEHNCLHWPFRSWCPHCVRGKAVTSPHPRKYDEVTSDGLRETAVTTLSLDYCFVSDVGEITTAVEFEAAGEGAAKILVLRDSNSMSVFAHVVPMKGVDEAGPTFYIIILYSQNRMFKDPAANNGTFYYPVPGIPFPNRN